MFFELLNEPHEKLTDELWNEIEPFFPVREVSPEGGRPATDNRIVLTCILFVLKTGIAWEDLPLELGCSYKTCGRRLREWTAAGVWQRLWLHLLTQLRSAGRLELADVLAVLSYYHRHRDEVEEYLVRRSQETEATRREIETLQPPRPEFRDTLHARAIA